MARAYAREDSRPRGGRGPRNDIPQLLDPSDPRPGPVLPPIPETSSSSHSQTPVLAPAGSESRHSRETLPEALRTETPGAPLGGQSGLPDVPNPGGQPPRQVLSVLPDASAGPGALWWACLPLSRVRSGPPPHP